jgi:hypothetical protein
MARLVSSSTTLAVLTNVSEQLNSTSPSAMQVKYQQKTIGTEQKLEAIKPT